MTSNRPKIFVSSTISDFKDLRSGIKFWLEQHGYEANLSEHNDFDRRPDAGAFRSCFDAIGECHFFLLLVGFNRGSFYDESRGISVTLQEYREATELARRNQIIPLVFVRSEVLTSIRALRDHEPAVSSNNGEILPPTSFEDYKSTVSFLDEIKRTEALRLNPTDPEDFVWRYPFNTFEDIVKALRVTLNLRFPMRRLTALANICQELASNLSGMVERNTSGLHFPTQFSKSVVDEVEIHWTTDLGGTHLAISPEQAHALWNFQLVAPSSGKLTTHALQWAIESGEFLDFDPTTSILVPSPQLHAIYELRSQINQYNQIASSYAERQAYVWAQLSDGAKNEVEIYVTAFDLATLFAMHNALENVIRISWKLIRAAQDGSYQFILPALRPWSPLKREIDRVKNETVEPKEVLNWIEQSEWNPQ